MRLVRCLGMMLSSLAAACGASGAPEDGGARDAGVDLGGMDLSVPSPPPIPAECADRYDVVSSQNLRLRDGRMGPLLYSEVRSAAFDTWQGLFVDGAQVSEGDIIDLGEQAVDPTTCAVCYFFGTECADPRDWRTCATLRLASRGRVWIGRYPEAVGDDAVVEMSDVFLEPVSLESGTLRTAPAPGGCLYQRYVSYTTSSVRDGELPCEGELHCIFARR